MRLPLHRLFSHSGRLRGGRGIAEGGVMTTDHLISLDDAQTVADMMASATPDARRESTTKNSRVSADVVVLSFGFAMATSMEEASRGNLAAFYKMRDEALAIINRQFDAAAARVAEAQRGSAH
jgi:hypothetical protein